MAPSHVDLSTLWVPIMPETSKMGEAMEQVGKDATESFGKGSSGLGDKIHESVTKSKDKIRDVFHRTGSDANDAMAEAIKDGSRKVEDAVAETGNKAKGKFRESAKEWGKVLVDAVGPDTKKLLGDKLEETVGGALDSVLGDNSKWGGKFARTIADWGFDELKEKVAGVKDTVNTAKQAFADLTGGDTTRGIAGLVDGFNQIDAKAKEFGIEIGDLPQPLQEAVDKTNDFKSGIKDASDLFKDMPGVIGSIGTAIGELAGPIAIMSAAIYEGLKGLQAVRDHIYGADLPMPPGADPDKWKQFTSGPTSMAPSDVFKWDQEPDKGNLGDLLGANDQPGTAGPPAKNFYKDWYPAASSNATLPTVPIVPRNVGSDSGLTPTSAQVKKTIATMFPQINDIGGWRPPDGYNEHSSGQALDVMIPNSNTPQGKALGDAIRDYVMKNAKSLGVDYALWQQTQWNPDGSHSGMENRGSPTQNHMDHVHVHTVRGAGSADPNSMPMPSMPGGTSASGDKIPTGAQHDPLFVMPAGKSGDTAGGSGGGNPWQSQGQQLGQGLFNGLLQETGLDGSVFKTFSGASSPADFGITKIGTGLLNWAGGLMNAQTGRHQSPSITSPTYNVDQSFNLTQNGVQGNGETPYKAAMNSSNRTAALAANMPGQ